MAYKDPTDYAFGQMGSIHAAGTETITVIGGRDSDSTPASNVNRITKVFVAITFLEDTKLTALVPDTSGYTVSDGSEGDEA